MNPTVINIGDRRGDPRNGRPPAAAPSGGPDIERVRRALEASFEILASLESNSGNEYFLARDTRGETVQLKVLSERASADQRARQSFVLEAQAASRLVHMNISMTSEPKQAHGVDFCVIDHKQDSQPLRQLLDRNGWLELDIAARIGDQIAGALDHAHSAGVLHLRLRPESVLVEPDGWVTVTDFGIECGKSTIRSGKPSAPYASPEQAEGMAVDHRSDLYSLGAIMYEMLTDRTPFDSNDAEYIRQKQAGFLPSPPHLISMDVPEVVSRLVMKLLERETGNRFESGGVVQAALDAAVRS